jgi:hypothetical protein
VTHPAPPFDPTETFGNVFGRDLRKPDPPRFVLAVTS